MPGRQVRTLREKRPGPSSRVTAMATGPPGFHEDAGKPPAVFTKTPGPTQRSSTVREKRDAQGTARHPTPDTADTVFTKAWRPQRCRTALREKRPGPGSRVTAMATGPPGFHEGAGKPPAVFTKTPGPTQRSSTVREKRDAQGTARHPTPDTADTVFTKAWRPQRCRTALREKRPGPGSRVTAMATGLCLA
jgi:hypothetical protein